MLLVDNESVQLDHPDLDSPDSKPILKHRILEELISERMEMRRERANRGLVHPPQFLLGDVTNPRSGSMPFLSESLRVCGTAVHRKILHKVEKSLQWWATKQKHMLIHRGRAVLGIRHSFLSQYMLLCHRVFSPYLARLLRDSFPELRAYVTRLFTMQPATGTANCLPACPVSRRLTTMTTPRPCNSARFAA